MMVEISDTIIDVVERYNPDKRSIKYNINSLLWQKLTELVSYNQEPELNELDIDDIAEEKGGV